LKKWPNLRINFAHFGGGDQLIAGKTDWMGQIIGFIKDYSFVYTDISYHTDKKSPGKILDVVGKNDCLNTKLMFGTDYIMIMMNMTLGGLEEYFNHYCVVNDKLLYKNAKDFLKI